MLKLFLLSYYLLLLLLISFAISSCSTFDPPVVIPAYGHIDSVHFTTSYNAIGSTPAQGTASSKITAAWVYLDDNPVGAFQLPCTFPIVAGNGLHNIKIYSGITAADENTAYNINPFYQYYSVSVNLQQGVTTKFQPASTYYTWVKFKYMEDFENQAPGSQPANIINFYGNGVPTAGSKTNMIVINTPKADVFQGQSGMVTLDQTKNYYIGITNPTDSLSTSGNAVYLEFNYKSTTTIEVGLFEEDTVTQISPVVIYPSATWNKMYVNLAPTIDIYSKFPNYRVYFAMSLDAQGGHTADTMLLDNIKIMQ